MNQKLIIIGLDGATYYLLDKLDKNKIPNLRKVMMKGYRNIAHSFHPPLSPPAWATICTGVNPAKHNVFDFFYMPYKKNKSYIRKIIKTPEWKTKTVFDILNANYMTCGVLNYPLGYPPFKIDKFFISGLGTPTKDSSYVYPPELKSEIDQKLPEYLIDAGGGVGSNYKEFLNICKAMGNSRIKTSKYLFNKYDVDLQFIVFSFTDRFQHWFWKFIDNKHPQYEKWDEPWKVYEGFFQNFDKYLGEIITDMNEEDTLLIISDHGFGPVKKYFYINKFLYEQGFLKFKKDEKIFTQQNTPDGLLKSINWGETKAYSLGDYGEIRINLKNREPLGIVSQGEEYKKLRKLIKSLLEKITDPEDGEKIIDKVYFKEELYSGEYLNDAPDLMFTMRNCEYICYINGRGNEFYNYDKTLLKPPSLEEMNQWNGAHNMEGIFIAYGKNVNKDAQIEKINLIDIAPTILYLKGIDIPNYMDGKALKDLFHKNQCEFCLSSNLEKITEIKSSQKGSQILICKNCGLVQSIFKNKIIGKKIRISSDANWGNIRYGKQFGTQKHLKIIDKYVDLTKIKNIIDVGSNRGSFIENILKKGNFNITAIEPDERISPSYEKYKNISLIHDRIENIDLNQKKFDFIYLSHTLEHLDFSFQTIKKLTEASAKSAFMLVEVPDLEFIKRDDIIEEFFIDKHKLHFTRNTLKQYFECFGWKAIYEDKNDKENILLLLKYDGERKYGLKGDRNNVDKIIDMIKSYEQRRCTNIKRLGKIAQIIEGYYPKKIGVWGTGRLFDALVRQGKLNLDKINVIIDTYLPEFIKEIHNKKIFKPQDIRFTDLNVLIIMSRVYADEIIQSAKKKGFKGKILRFNKLMSVEKK